ncbi:MAG: ABC transporter ATP-binding protein [Nitrososphaerales archaeon]
MLQGLNLSKRFGGVQAVDDVSFSLDDGSILGVIGPNGSGKSTLLKLVMGLERADSGRVTLDGVRLSGMKPYQVADRGVGFTFQLTRLFGGLSVFQNLLVAVASDKRGEETRKRGLELLTSLNLHQLRDAPAHSLSYGQRKLLELARAMMRNPKVILLDEPTAGVNPVLVDEMLRFMSSMNEDDGVSFLLVEHNIQVLTRVCERVMVMDHGELIAEGAAAEVLADEKVIDAYLGRA